MRRWRSGDKVFWAFVTARRWPVVISVLGGLAVGSALVSVTASMRGVPGVLALLVAVVVATRAGPAAGLAVAAGTGVAHWWELAGDPGRSGLLVAVPLWSGLAWVSGIGAAHLRVAREQRLLDELELRRRALHDPLTGLPNRQLVMDRLHQAQQRAHRHETLVAVLFLDLDNFKTVNDSLGHVAGDRLLTQVADRLVAALRGGDTAGRVGGDEFVVICEDLRDEREATAVAHRLSAAMNAPFLVGGRNIVCTGSIGIALTSLAAALPEDLLRDADLAMYRAKRRGRCRVEVFDSQVRAQADELHETEEALRRALCAGELRVVYQPITDLATNRVVGVETLVRWQHPTRGLLLPAEFLEVAEDSGLIVPIGRWILSQALQQTACWHARSGEKLAVSVNISLRQLIDSSFADTVTTTLSATGVDPSYLRLEITESALLEATRSVAADLFALETQGVSIGLDDFGTGYSSLAHLSHYPVRFLKIDRSFVSGVATHPEDAAIADAVVRMGESLGLQVIAQGIETAGDLRAIRALGCAWGQGFHLAMPSSADDISGLLAHSGAPSA